MVLTVRQGGYTRHVCGDDVKKHSFSSAVLPDNPVCFSCSDDYMTAYVYNVLLLLLLLVKHKTE